MRYINEEFNLLMKHQEALHRQKPVFGYNQLGATVYYRSYSRIIRGEYDESLGQENWADTVIRVINGIISIRKDWYIKNRIRWNESYWQQFAFEMSQSLFKMWWLPPGRGLWACGTELVSQKGSMALYNCAATIIGENWITDLGWLMDVLMMGCGVGFHPMRCNLTLTPPTTMKHFIVPDSREGWVQGLELLLGSFVGKNPLPEFDYSLIRPFGAPIRGFGGTASGPEPLDKMYRTMEELCYRYINNESYDEVIFKTDLANIVGVCVVAGNVRRSAEIALCPIDDPVFMDLKDLKKYPERAGWSWMSNNSVMLSKKEDFEQLDLVAQACIEGKDIGFLNLLNLKYGRVGKYDDVREDEATLCNPCAEIALFDKEVCNLAETLPTRCPGKDAWLKALEFATFYCSTVSLLPTHSDVTNAIVNRNRRIGVSIIDFSGWKEEEGLAKVVRHLREGYKHVRFINKQLADEAGIPASIRVTTVKPGGSVPKLAGRTSGASHPTFKYAIRRINVGVDTPVDKVLMQACIPFENSVYTPMTRVYEFPVEFGPARPATEVSLYEQAMNVVTLQMNWADNMVSNTLYFKPKWSLIYNGPDDRYKEFSGSGYKIEYDTSSRMMKVYRFDPNHEEDVVADVLSHIAPLTKSISLLAHSNTGLYAQMPEEGITREEYERRLAAMKPIDWTEFEGSDGSDEKYCTGDICQIL